MENNTDGFFEGDYDYIFDRPAVRACLCIAYTAVFIFCFFGNLIVVIVVSLHWRMRSVTKFCMGNLAFANLCVAIFCIYQNLSTFLYQNWIFGWFLCKMYYFINSLSHTASILILVVISVERYLSIVHPLKCRQMMTIQRLRLTIAAVWLLGGLINAPRLYYITTLKLIEFSPEPLNAHEDDGSGATENNITDAVPEVICAPTPTLFNSSTAEIIYFLLLFVTPLVIMSILYAKIASMIWQSSAMLQTVHLTSNDPPIPLSVRIVQDTPEVPHNSSATQSSASSSAPRSTKSTFSDSSSSSHGRQKPEFGKISKFRPSAETMCNSPDHGSCAAQGAEEANTNAIGSSGSLYSSCKRHVSLLAVNEILHHQSRRDRITTHVTVLRVKDERQGQVLKSRRSAIRMLIVIVITFAVCNFPYYVRRLCQYYVSSYNISSPFNQLLTPVTFLLMYANCAVNPVLYAFLSETFWSSFKDLLKFRLRRDYYAGPGRHHQPQRLSPHIGIHGCAAARTSF